MLIPVAMLVLMGASSFQSIYDVTVDDSTHAITTVDYAHHEVHSGSFFAAFHSAGSKNDGTTINIYFKTPNTTKYIHSLVQYSASGAAYCRIREAPTVTANTGTNAIDIYNHNRTSTKASTVYDNATSPAAGKYGKDVTVTAGGTVIYEDYSGSARSFAAASRSNDEFILSPNTAYVFEVESDAAGLVLDLMVSWYEHTNKE
jgi:hypothetical protein